MLEPRKFIVWEVFATLNGNNKLVVTLPYKQANVAHVWASHLPGGYVLRSSAGREPESVNMLSLSDGSRSWELVKEMQPATRPATVPVPAPVPATIALTALRVTSFHTVYTGEESERTVSIYNDADFGARFVLARATLEMENTRGTMTKTANGYRVAYGYKGDTVFTIYSEPCEPVENDALAPARVNTWV